MHMIVDTICWRRIDTPGHDACRLEQRDDGWHLDGAAVFRLDRQPVRLVYHLACDARWCTREGVVSGWVGERNLALKIIRTAGGLWTLNKETRPSLEECLDLDFGFTPATNLSQLRRIALETGQAAQVPVAWLDVTSVTLSVLQQRYERRTTDVYWYEAPQFNFATELDVRSSGFGRLYPPLWEEER
jgi:hypothetical protein